MICFGFSICFSHSGFPHRILTQIFPHRISSMQVRIQLVFCLFVSNAVACAGVRSKRWNGSQIPKLDSYCGTVYRNAGHPRKVQWTFRGQRYRYGICSKSRSVSARAAHPYGCDEGCRLCRPSQPQSGCDVTPSYALFIFRVVVRHLYGEPPGTADCYGIFCCNNGVFFMPDFCAFL